MNISLAAGIVLLAGAGGGKLARRLRLPSVTGNLVAGILIGPSVLNLLDAGSMYSLAPINELALGVIALSLGAELQWSTLRSLAGDAVRVFLVEASLTFLVVFGLMHLLGLPGPLAVMFAILAIATSPGALIACLREAPGTGHFRRVLLAVVALDDLCAIVAFGIVVSFLQLSPQETGGPLLLAGLAGIGTALALGGLAGLFLVGTARWARSDSRILVSVLGAVLVTVGMASLLEAPALLAAMAAGVVYTNGSRRAERIRRSLVPVEGLILLAFLTLAGAKMDLLALPGVGLVGLAYISGRFLAKLAGGRLGAALTSFPLSWKQNLGRALSPQAGVAIGLAIIAEQKLPQVGSMLITVILGAVVVFEIIGPILLRRALCAADREPGVPD